MAEWQRPSELPDLSGVDLVSIDTEENDEGLQAGRGSGWAWNGGYVCGISLAWCEGGELRAAYLPMRHPDSDNFDPAEVYGWLGALIARGTRFITMNGPFDWGWLTADGGIEMPAGGNIEEVAALATLTDENQRGYSLDDICGRFGLPGKDPSLLYEGIAALGLKSKGKKKLNARELIHKLPSKYVGPYAEIDAIRTYQAYERLIPTIDREGTRNIYRLECALVPVTIAMRRRGVRIDIEAAEEARNLLLGKRDAALVELSRLIGKPIGMKEVAGAKWKEETFEQYKIATPEKTPGGKPSFAKGGGENGWMVTHEHWLPRLIATVNKYNHAGEVFLNGHILGHVIEGRIYCQFHSFKTENSGTKSFRFSVSKPPLQQMPKNDPEIGPLIRDCFLAEEGEVAVSVDISQQEFRFVTHYGVVHKLPSAEEAAEIYRNNPDADFHQLVADITGLGRKPAKTVNFSNIYGSGDELLARQMGKTLAETRAIKAQYDEKLPFISKLDDLVRLNARRNGYTTLYGGARRHWNLYEVPFLKGKGCGPCGIEEARARVNDTKHPWYGRELARHGIYKSLNALVQGSSAIHTKLWLLAVWQAGITPLLQIHDELLCSIKTREQGELVARLGCEAVALEVPIKADPGYGWSWGDACHKWEDLPPAPEVAPTPVRAFEPSSNVIELPLEHIAITELSPFKKDELIGKSIDSCNHIIPYPKVFWWTQAVAKIPATMVALEGYFREARKRNICIIRGAPIDPSCAKILRRNIYFDDKPSRLLCIDIDGAREMWLANPEAAVRRIVERLGAPFALADVVWFFTAGHGLQTVDTGVTAEGNKIKQWTGRIIDGEVRVRLAFICDRALDCSEASSLTLLAKAAVSDFVVDGCLSYRVQINYVRRMHWRAHPDEDPLGDVQTIGLLKGAHENLIVPDDLSHKARWARAQGHGGVIASHPNAVAAVRAIGADGSIRDHLFSALWHLAHANPMPIGAAIGVDNHAVMLVGKLEELIKQFETEIATSLKAYGRGMGDVYGYFPKNVTDIAVWCIERIGNDGPGPSRKTIKLARVDEAQLPSRPEVAREDIFARVVATIEQATKGVTLLVAPPGSRKSTEIRKAAVKFVSGNPGKTAMLLLPRHHLVDEQIAALHAEHPDKPFRAAIWRGMHREDPEFIGPQRPGEEKLMCWRDKEARALEEAVISVKDNLCKKGRGKKQVRCPFFELCGVQRQARTVADIWLGARELLVHEKQKAFGDVGRIYIDESPLGAMTFGLEEPPNRKPLDEDYVLALDALLTRPLKNFTGRDSLMEARAALHGALSGLSPGPEAWRGAPAEKMILSDFLPTVDVGANGKLSVSIQAVFPPGEMKKLEWRGKLEPKIRPDMTAEAIEKALATTGGNVGIRKMIALWPLLGAGGRVQVYPSKDGRIIRMVGVHRIPKGWRGIPTLISDGTGDAELLRAIWPRLKCDTDVWQQMPRPPNVRIRQCVDKAMSKLMVAIEGLQAKREVKERAARRLWAVILEKAIEYAAEGEVGVVLYKSTKEWIIKNCFVPPWIKLLHHGDITGTNVLRHVRALFVAGRMLASAEAVTRHTEALFGDHIAERAYMEVQKGGVIPIVPDAAGNNVIMVDILGHPDPRAERVRRQITEAALLQALERGRIGLRGPGEDLDIWLLTDVPLPELGPVEPVLSAELETGLDGLMLATCGFQLENVNHAAKASGLFTAGGLKNSRASTPVSRGVASVPIETLIGTDATPPFFGFTYQLLGAGQKRARGRTLTMGSSEARAWLEAKLGPLIFFEPVDGKVENEVEANVGAAE